MKTVVRPRSSTSISKNPQKVEIEFLSVGSDFLEKRSICKAQRRVLMELPSPLYWWKFPGKGGRKIFWNWVLVQDYLLRGNTTDPQHQRLVEQYLATLPPTS